MGRVAECLTRHSNRSDLIACLNVNSASHPEARECLVGSPAEKFQHLLWSWFLQLQEGGDV